MMKRLSQLSIGLFALCFAGQAAFAKRQVRVVTSFSILADMVAQVGGEHVSIISIVGPDADTHTYEPTPQDVKAVASAELFVTNGLGFEGWMSRIVEASATHAKIVTASQGIQTQKFTDDGAEITDPHAWQNLGNGLIYVQNIADSLCEVDKDDCDAFKINAGAYNAEIKALDVDLRERVSKLPEEKRQVITTHDAFGYFASAYDIHFVGAEGLSTDSEPSAADVAKLVRQIKQSHTTALFLENMSDPRLIEQIAQETGVKAGGTLFADALSKPGEGGETYLAMFKHNVQLLIAAMQGS